MAKVGLDEVIFALEDSGFLTDRDRVKAIKMIADFIHDPGAIDRAISYLREGKEMHLGKLLEERALECRIGPIEGERK